MMSNFIYVTFHVTCIDRDPTAFTLTSRGDPEGAENDLKLSLIQNLSHSLTVNEKSIGGII